MALLVDESYVFTLADSEFYEPLERYEPRDRDYVNLVSRIIPPDWECKRNGIWYGCHAPGPQPPVQGWKIHLSATTSNALPLLATVARHLVARGVPFKFALDRMVFRLLHGKNWNRGGAGKFITVYPRDDEQFRELLEELHERTIGFTGPYILSDRRYRSSKVVHYRYGGMALLRELNVRGEFAAVIHGTDGGTVSDERQAFFRLPPGLNDPFADAPNDNPTGGENVLKDGRYLIESAISFSMTGGVYVATDQSNGAKVI
ncbi:MAG: class III lanthionine synthetase LanKC N-terminal domain-containing protein, partial [Gemmatimonadaceae bacterium]